MSARSRTLLLLLLGVVAAVLLTVAAREVDLASRTRELAAWSRDAGLVGALVYGVGYVVSTVLVLPGSALTLGAGFAWGPVWGVALVSPVSVLASTAAFVLGRTLLRSFAERKVGADARLLALDRAIGERGLEIVILLRLSPVLPFNLLNYGLSLTRVRLRDYVLGSAIGMFPATVLYVYLGSLVTTGSELASGKGSAGAAGSALYWGGLAATVGVVVLLTRASRAALAQAMKEPAT